MNFAEKMVKYVDLGLWHQDLEAAREKQGAEVEVVEEAKIPA